MIQDKIITIRKPNIFDKGWALFAPWEDFPRRNKQYISIDTNEIVRKITYATKIILILAEPCLSHRIIEELEWVGTEAKIYLLAKSSGVAEHYSGVRFSAIKIEPNLSVNYIAVTGEEGKSCYFIGDGFQRTDDAVEHLYASAKEFPLTFDSFDNADKVIVLDDGAKYIPKAIEYCLKKKIPVVLAKAVVKFGKYDYDTYCKTEVGLIVADNVGGGICIQKQGKLYHASLVRGQFVLVETESISAWLSGSFYSNMKKKAVLSGYEIPSSAFILNEGAVIPLMQNEWHIVEKAVPVASMGDFIAAKFDSSETEKHNEFSAIAKNVEYRFTLTPPHLPEGSKYSQIYNEGLKLYSCWQSASIPLEKIRAKLEKFQGNKELSSILQHIEDSNLGMRYVFDKIYFKGYHEIFSTCFNALTHDGEGLIDAFFALQAAISSEVGITQESGIQSEIEGYENTIREKEEQIRQSVNVLQNKRRIEILRQKIKDLQQIQGRISSVQSARSVTDREVFVARCHKILSGDDTDVETDSVSTIVHGAERSKNERLDDFLQAWLKPIDDALNLRINLIMQMQKIDVPEDYVVYDHAGKRYIVIEREDEYQKTMDLQKKYNLQCVVRK